MLSKCYFPLKESRVLFNAGRADSRAGAGKQQNELEMSCCAKKQGDTQKMMETCQKNIKGSIMGHLLAKSGTTEAPKLIKKVTDYNLLDSIQINE